MLTFTPNVTWAAVRLCYTLTPDTAANATTLTVTSIEVRSTKYTADYYPDGVLAVDGAPLLTFRSSSGNVKVQVRHTDTWYPLVYEDGTPVTASVTLPHDSDGTKTANITLTGNRFQRFAFYTVDGEDGNGWGVKQTLPLVLGDIPRASAIAATDAAIGAVSTVTVTRRVESHTHSVAFRFGSITGWLDADGSVLSAEKRLTASVIPFLLPEYFYGQLPDAPSGRCYLVCTTYEGDAPVGEPAETAITVTAAPGLCAPLVTGQVADCNEVTLALTGDPGKLIRYASTAYCSLTAIAQKGATITQTAIGGVPGRERVIEAIEGTGILFSAADSRGYTGSCYTALNLIPYIPLTARATARRLSPTADTVQLQVQGNCFSGSFGAAENTLHLTCRTGEQEVVLIPERSGDTYAAACTLSGLDYRTPHTLTLIAADAITRLEIPVTVGRGVPVFDWGEEDFAFHVPVALEEGATFAGKPLWELFYPVGAVFASAEDTDPSVLFGGAWLSLDTELPLRLWQRIG